MPKRPARLAWLLLLAPALAGCSEGAPKQAAPPPPAVTVANPVKRTVTDQDEYVGRFVAVDLVEMRARVSGYLRGPLSGRPDREAGRPPLHHRPAPVQPCPRPAPTRTGARQSGLRRSRSRPRRAARAQQDHHRADLRAAHAGQARGEASVTAQEALVRQAELDLQFTELRPRSPAASATGGCRSAIW